jgi:NADH-ubiquinone oxidoreductase chain 5
VIFFVFFQHTNVSYVIFRLWQFEESESFSLMSVSIFFLIILSIVSGFLFSDLFIGYGSYFWNNSIFYSLNNFYFLDVEFVNPIIKNLPILLSFIVMFILCFIWDSINFFNTSVITSLYNKVAPFFFYAFFFNKLYNFIYMSIFKYSYFISNKYLDKGLLEILGPYGLYKFFRILNDYFSRWLSSLIFIYLFVFFLSLVVFGLIIIVLNFINFSIILNNLFIFILFAYYIYFSKLF